MIRKKSDGWLEHALRRAQWQPQRQLIALATLGFFILLILGGLYLSQVAWEATTNRRLSTLLEQRDELERTNEQLRAEVATYRSVPRLQARARELGFDIARADQIEYLVVEGYFPQEQDTVAPRVVVESEQVLYNDTFFAWVGRQWYALTQAIQQLVNGGV